MNAEKVCLTLAQGNSDGNELEYYYLLLKKSRNAQTVVIIFKNPHTPVWVFKDYYKHLLTLNRYTTLLANVKCRVENIDSRV